MKLTHLLTLGMAVVLSTTETSAYDALTQTGIVWVNGVDESGGWHDANKVNNDDGDADDNMCYAASAANLIAWWQENSNLTSSAPKGSDNIWSTFVNNTNEAYWDEGGEALSAINWWISGVYYPQKKSDFERFYVPEDCLSEESELPLTLNPFHGYYYDQYGLKQEDLAYFLTEEWIFDDQEAGSINFVDMLDEGMAISLAIGSDVNAEFGHAITLWGAEYDNGELVKLWLTDSDDYGVTTEQYLFSAEATLDDDSQKIYFDDEDIYGEQVYIAAVYSLDPSVSANWKLVPEPATTTLSLLALCGLAARRRRR